LDPIIGRASGRKGKWTAVEDSKLKDAVETHGDKDWGVIASMVPGRTRRQCNTRWHAVLNPTIGLMAGRKGIKWTEDEDRQLKDAVQRHGDKDWCVISVCVPGRTKKQCNSRWHNTFNPSIALTGGSKGKWTAAEDSKLKDAVQTHCGKDWAAISALVPGRTKSQCSSRWNDTLDPNIDRPSGRKGKWTEDEDSKLKDAVQTHGDKDWVAICALVPGRTRTQCNHRWRFFLDPSIGQASGRKGKWTAVEDSKLKNAVLTHGDKD
jgi:hypothetical protein